ncbi:hypothetical protein BDR06DRAFT_430222 [Suillus hirtellus]|nr:hypothetical protein BDR06DRAFT_430222 [Suillus hirtellus]
MARKPSRCPRKIWSAELDRAQLERRIRLLSLVSLLCTRWHDLPYLDIVSILQIEFSQVERWAIDAIHISLLSGKLHTFTVPQHARLSDSNGRHLVAWNAGLASVLELVTNAQKCSNGSVVGEFVQQVTQMGESVQVDAA